MNTLSTYLEHQAVGRATLPLVHLTPLSRFRRIMASDRLVPQACPILRRDILYCSYGDPVHRPSREDTEWYSDPPVALLLSPALLRTKFGFAPLDTGAIASGRVPWLPRRVRTRLAADYCVADDNARLLAGWIGSIYGGDQGYMRRANSGIRPDAPDEAHIGRLLGMAAADWSVPDRTRDDMRVISQVECHFYEPIALDRHLIAAFLPYEAGRLSWNEVLTKTVARVARYYSGATLDGTLPPDLSRLVAAGVAERARRVH